MMTSPIGSSQISADEGWFREEKPGDTLKRRRRTAFTLVELVLVMAMLVIVIAVAAPSLSHFFRGRTLDSEVGRFLSLTRYAQSRAVSEGVPMVLWMEIAERTYGLQQEPGYSNDDSKAVEYRLGEDLQFEVADSAVPQRTTGSAGRNQLRFLPDGSIGETSPTAVGIRSVREGETEVVWMAQSRSGMNYEIRDQNKLRPNASR